MTLALPAIVMAMVDMPSADLTQLVLQERIAFALSPGQQPMHGLPHLLRELLLLIDSPRR